MKFIIMPLLFSVGAMAAPATPKATNPAAGLEIHLVGVHPEKESPHHQSVVHHYCRQMNPDFAQCALYDGEKQDSNLMGIEYIISGKAFDKLSSGEKKYWHPHNYEILSGMLSAPDLTSDVEKSALKGKMNSYGKTWHVWRTKNCCNGSELPLGSPSLMWSLNRDGQATPLVEEQLKNAGIDVAAKRAARADLATEAKPQEGFDALDKFFP